MLDAAQMEMQEVKEELEILHERGLWLDVQE